MIDFSSTRRRLNDALSLLKEERSLLLRGDIQALAKFEVRRAKVAERLPRLPRHKLAKHQPLVEKVRSTARRNAELLEAFLDGARAAEQRLTALEKANAELGVYDEDGRKLGAAGVLATRSKRA